MVRGERPFVTCRRRALIYGWNGATHTAELPSAKLLHFNSDMLEQPAAIPRPPDPIDKPPPDIKPVPPPDILPPAGEPDVQPPPGPPERGGGSPVI